MSGRVARHDAGWIKRKVAHINSITDNGELVVGVALISVIPVAFFAAIIASETTWWIMTYLFWLILPAFFGLVRLTLISYRHDYDPLPKSLRTFPKLKRYGLAEIALPMINEMYDHGNGTAHDYTCDYCNLRGKTILKLEDACDNTDGSVEHALEFLKARKELTA